LRRRVVRSFVQTWCADELGPGGREDDLPRRFEERFEERGRSVGVELARYVVEEQDGKDAARLGDARELGELQCERDGAVLALGGVRSSAKTTDLDDEIVPVRSARGASSMKVTLALSSQRFLKLGLVFRPTWLIPELDRSLASRDPSKGRQHVLHEPF